MDTIESAIRTTWLPCLVMALLVALCPLTGLAEAGADATPAPAQPSAFAICPDQPGATKTFALCATATCWTLDGVAYCKCDVKHQPSISAPFNYRENGERKNVCDLLQAGRGNGFTVSTYATPRQVSKDYDQSVEHLGPPMALYTCAAGANPSAVSAQCDGGLCFTSTRGREFPGFGKLKDDEIICSCPIVTNAQTGFQIAGPWSCAPGDKNIDGHCCDEAYAKRYCNVDNTNRTGTSIAVGSPSGSARLLSTELDGEVPRLNRCTAR